MARTDDAPDFPDRDALRSEEGALAAFFDAARAEPPPTPSTAFLAATLRDAEALARRRAPLPRALRPHPEGSRARPWPEAPRARPWPGGPRADPHPETPRVRPWRSLADRIGARLAPVGGWAGAGALAASTAIGFWAGAAGLGADYAAPTLWPDVTAMESAAAGIGDFFDLASLEG